MAIITTWPSSILNRPLPVHSVIILSMECWPLCDCQHFIINGDGIPLLDEDFTDGTGLGCADLGFHFHGFEDNQHIALFHGVTRRNVHLPDIAAQRRNHRLTVASNRSEEHTSELQSRPHLVCRLLLEKKKNIKIFINHTETHP